MTETSSSDTDRFAVRPLVAATYRTMLADAGLFLATVWPVFLSMVAIEVAVSQFPEPWTSAALFVAGFAAMPLYAPFIVAWTRRVLGRDAPTGMGVLVYDAAVWRVLKLQAILFGIYILAIAVVGAAAVTLRTVGMPLAGLVLIVLGVAVSAYGLIRLTIVLTVAVEEGGEALSRSWGLTRGRVFRITVGLVLATFLPGTIAAFLASVVPEGRGMLAAFPRLLANNFASFVLLGLATTYSAFVYRALVPPGEPVTAMD